MLTFPSPVIQNITMAISLENHSVQYTHVRMYLHTIFLYTPENRHAKIRCSTCGHRAKNSLHSHQSQSQMITSFLSVWCVKYCIDHECTNYNFIEVAAFCCVRIKNVIFESFSVVKFGSVVGSTAVHSQSR